MGPARRWIRHGLQVRANSPQSTTAADSISRQFVTTDGFDNQITIDAQSTHETGRLCDTAWARRLCIWQFPALRGDRRRRRPFQLRDDRNGAFGGYSRFRQRRALPFDITQTSSVGKDNAIVGGVAAGLGVDWAITPGMFLRGLNGNTSPFRRSMAPAAISTPPTSASACDSRPSQRRALDPRLISSSQLAAVDRGGQVAYLRQWDTPPHRGAPIWKDRP